MMARISPAYHRNVNLKNPELTTDLPAVSTR
jgi:hypothetical protein